MTTKTSLILTGLIVSLVSASIEPTQQATSSEKNSSSDNGWQSLIKLLAGQEQLGKQLTPVILNIDKLDVLTGSQGQGVARTDEDDKLLLTQINKLEETNLQLIQGQKRLEHQAKEGYKTANRNFEKLEEFNNEINQRLASLESLMERLNNLMRKKLGISSLNEIIEGKMYLFGRQDHRVNFTEAKAICKEHGGQLPDFASEIEYKKVHQSMVDNGLNEAWTSITDLEEQGVYKSINTNQPPLYVSWIPGNPSNVIERCAHMVDKPYWSGSDQGSKGFNDIPCDRRINYICQSVSNN